MLPFGVAAIEYFNENKITSSAEVKLFVMLTVLSQLIRKRNIPQTKVM